MCGDETEITWLLNNNYAFFFAIFSVKHTVTARLEPPTHPKRNLPRLQERLLRLHQGMYVLMNYEVVHLSILINEDTLFPFQPSFTRREDSEELFFNHLLLLKGERTNDNFRLRCITISMEHFDILRMMVGNWGFGVNTYCRISKIAL